MSEFYYLNSTQLSRVFRLYLLQFLHHFLDAQISAAAHLVLHLSQPVAELFVLIVEDGPGIETVCYFLSSQGHLGRGGSG